MAGFKSIVLGALLVTPMLAWSTTTTNYLNSSSEGAVGGYGTHDTEQGDKEFSNSLELNMNSKSYEDGTNISRKITGTTSLGSDFSNTSQQPSYDFNKSHYLKDSYHSDDNNISGVPIPGAVWLMGSAILGLFSFGKRKKILAS